LILGKKSADKAARSASGLFAPPPPKHPRTHNTMESQQGISHDHGSTMLEQRRNNQKNLHDANSRSERKELVLQQRMKRFTDKREEHWSSLYPKKTHRSENKEEHERLQAREDSLKGHLYTTNQEEMVRWFFYQTTHGFPFYFDAKGQFKGPPSIHLVGYEAVKENNTTTTDANEEEHSTVYTFHAKPGFWKSSTQYEPFVWNWGYHENSVAVTDEQKKTCATRALNILMLYVARHQSQWIAHCSATNFVEEQIRRAHQLKLCYLGEVQCLPEQTRNYFSKVLDSEYSVTHYRTRRVDEEFPLLYGMSKKRHCFIQLAYTQQDSLWCDFVLCRIEVLPSVQPPFFKALPRYDLETHCSWLLLLK
jgi:hypothetical protein